MQLSLGQRTYDLTARALVLGVGGPSVDLVARGADVLELGATAAGAADPVPVVPRCGLAVDGAELDRALAAGADLLRLPAPTPSMLERCASAGAAVVIPDDPQGVADAIAAGLPVDRIVPEALLLDVTHAPCALAATVAGVIRGARIVRTDDVVGARRVCDVLAAIQGAAG